MRWNAAAITCVVLVAVSFVMAGRVYGAEQEKANQRAVASRRYQSAYEFSQIVENAGDVLDRSFALNVKPGDETRKEVVDMAAALRRVAGELEKAAPPDDRVAAIKVRMVDLMNKRANALEQAKNDSTTAAAISADHQAFDAVFDDYADWIASVKNEFKGLLER